MNPNRREHEIAEKWAARFHEADRDVPFSFNYGGRPSGGALASWGETTGNVVDTGDFTKESHAYSDGGGLAVRAELNVHSDFPALEWVLHLKNNGTSDTPLIEDLQALDAVIPLSAPEPCSLRYSKGSLCLPEDFMPCDCSLFPKGRWRFQPGGGRSSSEVLPFFNVDFGGHGFILAVGWTGEWAAEFTRDDAGALRVRAGMDHTCLKLHPGEEIRTPRILMVFWKGDRMRGHNLLRRFILKHHRPKADGKPVVGPLCNGNWGATPAEVHLDNIRKIIKHELPFEYYWIDAEWFGKGGWPVSAGDWQVKPDLYPNGFKPISDLLHQSGKKFLLWMEYERVSPGTPWASECAKWLLRIPESAAITWADYGGHLQPQDWAVKESHRNQLGKGDSLFNLGDPDARRFLTDYISKMISEFGIDCLRQDSNIAHLTYWRHNDAPDRQGITEIRYVEGQYALWDELLARHPNLMIDNCASGGRRIDIESISRSTPLWRTDFTVGNGDPTAVQRHTHGLLLWVPLNGTGGGYLDKFDNYNLRSKACSTWVVGLHGCGDAAQQPIPGDYPFAKCKEFLEQYLSIRDYFYGDYYPLTEYSVNEDAWMVYQLDRPEQGDGLIVALKRSKSPFDHGVFRLWGLKADAKYKLIDVDSGKSKEHSSTDLMNRGLDIELKSAPSSGIIKYGLVK